MRIIRTGISTGFPAHEDGTPVMQGACVSQTCPENFPEDVLFGRKLRVMEQAVADYVMPGAEPVMGEGNGCPVQGTFALSNSALNEKNER